MPPPPYDDGLVAPSHKKPFPGHSIVVGSATHNRGNVSRSGNGGQPPPRHGGGGSKNEMLVYRLDEVKPNDPNVIQEALADLANRKSMTKKALDVTDDAKSQAKSEKDKANGLEGIDLNNYASVVIVDDQPEVTTEDPKFIFDTNDGFQEVMSKKAQKERQKALIEAEIKKQTQTKKDKEENRKSKNNRNSYEHSRQKLPPRLVKQRENNRVNLVKSSISPSVNIIENEMENLCKSPPLNAKDSTPAPPPPVNAWEKPISVTLLTHNSTSTSPNLPPVMDGVIAANSKSSSFDRDNHDSGIEVSDQPASGASSQRSSPSNDCRVFSKTVGSASPSVPVIHAADPAITVTERPDDVLSMDSVPVSTIVFENTNFKTENSIIKSSYTVQAKGQDIVSGKDIGSTDCLIYDMASAGKDQSGGDCLQGKPIEQDKDLLKDTSSMSLAATFKGAFDKAEAVGSRSGGEMKLNFSFQPDLPRIGEKAMSPGSAGGGGQQQQVPPMSRAMQQMTGSGVHSPISPSAAELDLKIASVKKVWESMPAILEHPGQPNGEDAQASSPFNTFAVESGAATAPPPFCSAMDGNAAAFVPAVDPGKVDIQHIPGGGLASVADVTFVSPSPLPAGSPSSVAYSSPVAYTVVTTASVMSGLGSKMVVASEHTNVCKVKPQQQAPQMASFSPPPIHQTCSIHQGCSLAGFPSIPGGTASQLGISTIPSPPTVVFNSSQQFAQTGLYQAFPMDGGGIQSQAAGRAAPFSQAAAYGAYGLSQAQAGLGQPPMPSSFGPQQNHLYVQTPPLMHQNPADLYAPPPPPTAAPAPPHPQFRLPPYAQSQHVTTNHNTVLISSPAGTSGLTVKPAGPPQSYGTIGTKSGQIGAYAQNPLTTQSLPPSQLYLPYEPSHVIAAGPPAQQNLPPSHLISSQLVQRPAALQGLQGSYYSSGTQNMAAAGFYQGTPGSPLQAHQQVQQPPPVPMQPPHQFGLPPSQMNVLPPSAAPNMVQTFQGAPTFKMQHELSSPIRSHSRSPASFVDSAGHTFTIQPASNSSSPVTASVDRSGLQALKGSKQGQNPTEHVASQFALQFSKGSQPFEPFKALVSTKWPLQGAPPATSQPLVAQTGMLRHCPVASNPSLGQPPPPAMRFPSPIQRPNPHAMLAHPPPAPLQQAALIPPLAVPIQQQRGGGGQSSRVPGKGGASAAATTQPPNSVQQAKLRAEAVKDTQLFFSQQSAKRKQQQLDMADDSLKTEDQTNGEEESTIGEQPSSVDSAGASRAPSMDRDAVESSAPSTAQPGQGPSLADDAEADN